jgi:EAL domain-containing protein (putative c-di-GMP-specific phosphodiesterase class I)
VLREPIVVDGHTVTVEASVGVAITVTGPIEATAPGAERALADALLRDADVAMYRAKAGGKGRFVQFEQGMHEQAMARLEMEFAIREAIRTEAFSVVYQPVVELRTREVRGVEALVRWNHPQRGPLSPDDFVPLAEETGLIRHIGRLVLREACRQLRSWRDAGTVSGSHFVTVNVSTRQLADASFQDEVLSTLAASGLPHELLQLEVTETALLDRDGTAIATLRALRETGVRVAVDDFGTGYSSLSSIKVLPVDALKIDRSFVSGLGSELDDTSIVSAIIAFAHVLGLTVTAEGVETDDQATALGELGCQLGQGFLFGRPQPPSD